MWTPTRFSATLLLGCTVFAPGAVHAQSATATTGAAPEQPVAASAPGQLGEIVVTARKKSESLQRTPIAISVLSAKAIAESNTIDVVSLASGLPNVTASTGSQGASDANFFIRGVGQTDFIVTSEPGVALYIDGVYIAHTVGALIDSGDVARVEVLRGPQGTLFGRNAIGGAVSVVTKDPSPAAFGFDANLTTGSRDRIDGEVAINIPLGSKTALRVLGLSRNQTGWGRNRTTGTTWGDIERLGTRVTLRSELTDNLIVRLSGDYTKDDGSTVPGKSRGVNRIGLPPSTQLPPGIEADVGGSNYDIRSDADPVSRVRVGGVSGTIEWKVGAVTFKSITAWRALKAFSIADYDATSFKLYNQSVRTDQDQVSQELQFLGKIGTTFDYVVGGFYFHERGQGTQDLCIASAPVPYFPTCGFWEQNNDQRTTSWAGYGRGELAPARSVHFHGGRSIQSR